MATMKVNVVDKNHNLATTGRRRGFKALMAGMRDVAGAESEGSSGELVSVALGGLLPPLWMKGAAGGCSEAAGTVIPWAMPRFH